MLAVKLSKHCNLIKSPFLVSLSKCYISVGNEKALHLHDDFSDFFFEEMEFDKKHQIDISIEAEIASKRNGKIIHLMRVLYMEDNGLEDTNCFIQVAGLYSLANVEN